MSLYKEQIEKFPIKQMIGKSKAGVHKWMKRQMNKFIRRKPIEDDEIGSKTNRKPTVGWEY